MRAKITREVRFHKPGDQVIQYRSFKGDYAADLTEALEIGLTELGYEAWVVKVSHGHVNED